MAVDLSRFTSDEIRAELSRREKRRPQKRMDPPALLTVAGRALEKELAERGGRKTRCGVEQPGSSPGS